MSKQKYRELRAGEIIRVGDEVEVFMDDWRPTLLIGVKEKQKK